MSDDFQSIAALDLIGRPFLSESGNTVMRGFVESFSADDTHWDLLGRDMERLDKDQWIWVPDPINDFGGTIERTSTDLDAEGMLELSCYGSVYYLAPVMKTPWQDIIWPEMDGFPGGRMNGGGAAFAQDKKERRPSKSVRRKSRKAT